MVAGWHGFLALCSAHMLASSHVGCEVYRQDKDHSGKAVYPGGALLRTSACAVGGGGAKGPGPHLGPARPRRGTGSAGGGRRPGRRTARRWSPAGGGRPASGARASRATSARPIGRILETSPAATSPAGGFFRTRGEGRGGTHMSTSGGPGGRVPI